MLRNKVNKIFLGYKNEKMTAKKLNQECFFFLLYVIIMLPTSFRVNLHSIVAWMSRNSLLETGVVSEVRVTVTRFKHRTL